MNKLVLAALVCLVVAGAVVVSYPSVIRYSLVGYVKDVPVQVGYDSAKSVWILTSVVSETEAFKMTLKSGATQQIGSDTAAQAQSEVAIVIEPNQPFSKTGLAELTTQYASGKTLAWLEYSYVPGKDVDDTSWLTTAVYTIRVAKNGFEMASMTAYVNYKEPRYVTFKINDQAIEISNLGMIPQGVEVPSGDLVVVEDGRSGKPARHIWMKADLNSMVDSWNVDGTYWAPYGRWDWKYVLDWAEQRGKLPQDVPLAHVQNVDISESEIKLTYGGIVFAGFISIQIPASLADTIIVQQFMPKPKIVSVSPQSISVKEGESTTLSVAVKNEGTEGTVSISASSPNADFIPITPSSVNMKQGETYTFQFKVLGREVDQTGSASATILVQGRGGSDTKTISVTVENVERQTAPEGSSGLPTLPSLTPSWGAMLLLLAAAFFFILIVVLILVVALRR